MAREAGSNAAATDSNADPSEPQVAPGIRGARLPLVLVLVSLSLAILLPHLADRRIARLRNDINNVADPARLRVAETELALAHGGSARRGYLLTGDRDLAAQFTAARLHRRNAERQLVGYTRELDGNSRGSLSTMAARLVGLESELDSLVRGVGCAVCFPVDLKRAARAVRDHSEVCGEPWSRRR